MYFNIDDEKPRDINNLRDKEWLEYVKSVLEYKEDFSSLNKIRIK